MHLQKEELAVVALLLCAAVTSFALFVVAGNGPGAPYSKASKAGDVVYLEGMLLHKEKTQSGGHLLLTVKVEAELVSIFVRSSSPAFPAADAAVSGNVIAVQGKVQDYKGAREIDASTVTIK